jgi:hypothetical protein
MSCNLQLVPNPVNVDFIPKYPEFKGSLVKFNMYVLAGQPVQLSFQKPPVLPFQIDCLALK